MKSTYQKIAVYDLETGGLKNSIHPISEIAIVIIDLSDLSIVDEYTALVKPYNPELVYDPEAVEVTKLTPELLEKDGIDSRQVVKEVVAFLKKHTSGSNKPIIAGHNIEGFDNAFLFKFMQEHKVDIEKLINPNLMIDTLKWARLRWFEMVDFQLGTCVSESELVLKGAHRALPDTISNAEMLVKMLKGLRGEGAQKTKYVRRKFSFEF